MTDPLPTDTRIESLPAGPLTHEEALGLAESGAFQDAVPAGSLVLHDPEVTLVVGLALATADRVVGAVYQPEERAWHRVHGAPYDPDVGLEEAIDVVERALTGGEGPDKSIEMDDGTDARVSAVDADDRDRLLAQYQSRSDAESA